MSTLTLQTQIAPQSKFGGFDRLLKSVLTFVEVFAEAQQMAAEAHHRFPFGRW